MQKVRRFFARKYLSILISITLLLSLIVPNVMAATTYQPTWASVNQHTPAPTWFQDAKFGIYFHWGAFSVPAFGSEWYPRNMYVSGSKENTHHISTYGDPATVFPYNKFITGGNDKNGNFVQFAPKLKSAGGNFDPNEWAQLFVDAGAKFAGPVAEHHDGFSMWDSTVNEWNSVDMGPKLDLVGQFATAIRAKNLKLLAALHTAYNYNGYYDRVPTQSTTTLKKLFGQLPKAQEDQLYYDKLKEVIDGYQPDIIWQDFDLPKVSEAQRLNFLSYYYNKAIDWNKEVVATFKDGFNTSGEVYDYERGGPADINPIYWLTDDSISSSSWSYTQGIGYYSNLAMLHSLIDRVSKNGNMLLNIAPMADGTIPQAQKNILLSMGDWLKKFGESIYSTRAWTTYGEGPTKMGGGSFTTPKAGTNKDIRFTRNKSNNTLYATVLGWPGNGAQLNISTLASGNINLSTLTNVQLLGSTAGSYINLGTRTQDSGGLKITMPASQPYTASAYVVKLTFSGQIPATGSGGFDPSANYKIVNRTNGKAMDSNGNVASGTSVIQNTFDGTNDMLWQIVDSGGGYYRLVNRTNGLVMDSGGNVASESAVKQYAWNGSNNLQWQIIDSGGGYYRIVNRTNGFVMDSGGNVAAGSPVKQYAWNGSNNLQWQIVKVN